MFSCCSALTAHCFSPLVFSASCFHLTDSSKAKLSTKIEKVGSDWDLKFEVSKMFQSCRLCAQKLATRLHITLITFFVLIVFQGNYNVRRSSLERGFSFSDIWLFSNVIRRFSNEKRGSPLTAPCHLLYHTTTFNVSFLCFLQLGSTGQSLVAQNPAAKLDRRNAESSRLAANFDVVQLDSPESEVCLKEHGSFYSFLFFSHLRL